MPLTEAASIVPRYTSYPATPVLSVDGVQDKLTLEEVVPVTLSPAGTLGACVSLPLLPDTVALTAPLAAEILPAASFALTVKL